MFKSCESCALLTDSAHDFQTEVVMIACLCGAGVAFMHKGKPILPPPYGAKCGKFAAQKCCEFVDARRKSAIFTSNPLKLT